MSKILIPCDECGVIFAKPKCRIHKVNFCCRKCMDNYNSKRFTTYNENENPMNAKGRTIEQRFAMRKRRILAKDRVGKEAQTYNRQFGELEHRKIMRLKLGRPLEESEVVHHKDGNPHNNKPSNLQVMTRSEHTRLHIREYWRNKHASE